MGQGRARRFIPWRKAGACAPVFRHRPDHRSGAWYAPFRSPPRVGLTRKRPFARLVPGARGGATPRSGRARWAPRGAGVREIVTPDGRLVLTEAALAAIARAAALRCPGVAGTAPSGLPGEIRGLLLGEADAARGGAGVEVDLDADHLGVVVDIIVLYGAHIPSVATAVVAAVADDLAAQAGIRPRRLQVRVQGVRRSGVDAEARGRTPPRAFLQGPPADDSAGGKGPAGRDG